MRDFQWKDLKDAQVSENVLPSFCGSTLTFKGNYMRIEVFPSLEIASKSYKHAQQEEQAWEVQISQTLNLNLIIVTW